MCNKHARGLTLIELLIFIVIIGIAANAMLGVFARLTQSSAGLLPDKQAQAIASSMMNEILAQPFPSAATDNAMGPEGTEARNGATPFDSVNDYHNPAILTVKFPNPPGTGVTAIPSLVGYSYQVTVAPAPAPVLPNLVTPNDALLVTVIVNGPNGTTARLDGVRVRYAP